MRRSALFIAALLIACSSDDGGRSKDPPVNMLGGSGGAGGAGAGGGGAVGGAGGTTDPIGGTGGITATGGVGDPAGTGVAGTDFPPLEMRTFDAGDSAGNNVTPGTICTRLAQIQCAGEAYCCENPGRDRPSCEAAQAAACAEGMVDMVAADPKAGFDAAHAATAFTQLEQMASMCDPTVASWGATTTGFIGIFKGSFNPGEECGPTSFVPDQKQAAVAIASCNNIETTACLPGSNTLLGNWTCAAKGPADSVCLTDLNCQDGLYCPNPALAAGTPGRGKCAPRLADGSPCGAGNECTSLYCINGSCAPPSQEAAYCLMTQL